MKKSMQKRLENDFLTPLKVKPFDTSKLAEGERKPVRQKRWWKPVLIGVPIAAVVLVVAVPVIASMRIKESVSKQSRNYSLSQLKQLEDVSFRRINSFTGAENEPLSRVSAEIKEEYSRFALNFYQAMPKKENMTFSIPGAFSIMNHLSYGASAPYAGIIDNLFATSKANRKRIYGQVYNQLNRTSGENVIAHHNGFFYDDAFEPSTSFVAELTALKTEAFQGNLQDVAIQDRLVAWMNAYSASSLMSRKDLAIDEESAFVDYSTLYFAAKWGNEYVKDKNEVAPFTLADGSTLSTTFMRHSYYGAYYDYGEYVGVIDGYENGCSVQYLVPKEVGVNIRDVLEMKTCLLPQLRSVTAIIDLSVPRFRQIGEFDFKDTLVSLGLGDLYDRETNSLPEFFETVPPDTNMYLQKAIQKNDVTFDESGTIVRSITFAVAAAGAAAPGQGTLRVKLDQPFVYVLYDVNGFPFFIGHQDRPSDI